MSDQPTNNRSPDHSPSTPDEFLRAFWQDLQADAGSAPVSPSIVDPQNDIYTGASFLELLGDLILEDMPEDDFAVVSSPGSTPVADAATPNLAPLSGPITVASVLPPTVYRDAEDQGTRNADGTTTPRTLSYIAVQRSVLAWLSNGRNTTDVVTPTQLRTWTLAIDPSHHQPTPQQALTLCYYMRELGFDTYSRVDPAAREVRLFLANPHRVSRRADTCYWRQTMGTQVILPPNGSAAMDGGQLVTRGRQPGHGRRAAISADDGHPYLPATVMDELINPPDPTGGLVASGPSGTTGGTADTWVPENEGPGRFAGHVSDPNANDVLADMLRPIRDEIPELRESLNEVLDLLSGIGRRGRN